MDIGHTYHVNGLRVDSFRHDPPLMSEIVDKLIECSSLDLLVFEVTKWIQTEVKDDTTLTKLLYE